MLKIYYHKNKTLKQKQITKDGGIKEVRKDSNDAEWCNGASVMQAWLTRTSVDVVVRNLHYAQKVHDGCCHHENVEQLVTLELCVCVCVCVCVKVCVC